MFFLKGNFLKSFSANAFNKIFNIFSQLVIIPLYLEFWGKEYYGEWLLLSIIPNYLLLSDFGLNVTSVTEICKLVIEKRYDDALKVYKAVNGFFLLLSVFILTAYVCFIFTFNLRTFLHFRIISNQNAILSTFFLLSSVFISIFWGTLVGIFRAEGRFDKQVNYTTLISIIDIAIIVFVLYNNYSIIFLAGIQMSVRLLIYFILVQIISKNYSWFQFGIIFNFSQIKKLLPSSIYYTFLTFGHAMILQGTAFIIGRKLGASSLVVFSITRTLVNSVKSFSSVTYLSFVSEFTTSLFKKDFVLANTLYKRMLILIGGQSIFMTLVLYFFGAYIFRYWTGSKIQLQNPFFNYMLISIILQSLWNSATMVPLSINENQRIKFYAPFALIFTLVLNFVVDYSGLSMVGIAMIVFDCIMLIYILTVTNKILQPIDE